MKEYQTYQIYCRFIFIPDYLINIGKGACGKSCGDYQCPTMCGSCGCGCRGGECCRPTKDCGRFSRRKKYAIDPYAAQKLIQFEGGIPSFRNGVNCWRFNTANIFFL